MPDLSLTAYETISIFINLFGSFAIALPLFLVYRQIHSRVFCEYTKRFSEVFPPLLVELRNIRSAGGFEHATDADREKLSDNVRLYLNLCSEEFHLNEKWFLHSTTWRIWDKGITEILTERDIRLAAKTLTHEYEFFPKFNKYLNGKLSLK